MSVDGWAIAEEAKATRGGKPKGWASVEEPKPQASNEEAKGQAYQAYKIENKESLEVKKNWKKQRQRYVQ